MRAHSFSVAALFRNVDTRIIRKKSAWILRGSSGLPEDNQWSCPPQHFLNFLPLPHRQGSFLPIFGPGRM